MKKRFMTKGERDYYKQGYEYAKKGIPIEKAGDLADIKPFISGYYNMLNIIERREAEKNAQNLDADDSYKSSGKSSKM